eukprot:COSAG02_NODE_15217_length_1193_cov_1.343693_3_plen_97_part_01
MEGPRNFLCFECLFARAYKLIATQEPLIDITTPPELWASIVVKGVNSYCSELDAPRPAATSQVGVVTDLLTMTTEARELEDVHAMILQKLTATCESQ